MVKRNIHFGQLAESYLFAQIAKRKLAFQQKHPKSEIINLGVGDTKLPIPKLAAQAMEKAAREMATPSGYRGYGLEQGELKLRCMISEKIYGGAIKPDEIFIGDGVKCDIARLQVLLGSKARIGVQDPTYPAYVDSAILTAGATLAGQARIKSLACSCENGFFPDLDALSGEIEVLFFCSPNNPTGFAASKKQLRQLVDWALEHSVLLVFDAAYSWYIRDEDIPLSIFEIKGARDCALEFNSFSKMAGFTGVRLSWTALPTSLNYSDHVSGEKRGLHRDWLRLYSTLFNGASNIAQAGGLACLTDEGRAQVRSCTDYYMENAALLRSALKRQGIKVVGGRNAPYLWARLVGRTSWEIFDDLLSEHQILATPGVGFGPQGEGYVRFSALGLRGEMLIAIERLSKTPVKISL